MTECKRRWTENLPPYPTAELEAIRQTAGETLYAVCGCFRLFRYLHSFETPEAALLGDYCFGRFSRHLAGLDSVPLTDAFALYLREDTADSHTFAEYLDFIGALDACL